MLLMIDNYDSFTYNLVQYFGELGETIDVRRNDAVTVDDITSLNPEYIVLSPGPCTPTEAGVSLEVVTQLQGQYPILGVCLGHQSIGQALGGKIVTASTIMHGKTSKVFHTGKGVFRDVPQGLEVTRYHSLVVDPTSLPACLEITAWTEQDGKMEEIMGLRHKEYQLEGVQFHPESICTEHGHQMLKNFLENV
jgi:anthranilate synthase component II